MNKNTYLLTLTFLGALFFVWLAISPYDRSDWVLENVLTVICVSALFFTYRCCPLSTLSYTLIFLFFLLHETGAHFTYAKVPYNAFFIHSLGFDLDALLGFERNQFDRLVHLLYGMLLVYPIHEIFQRGIKLTPFWSYVFAVDVVMSTSMLFELFEWAAAEIFGGDLGIAYLGTQGDVWDAHKDMFLASLGAVLVVCGIALFHRCYKKTVSI